MGAVIAMSRDARIAVVGTVAGTGWAVFAALSMDARVVGAALAAISLAVPLAMWWIAARLRARGSPRADTVVVWALPAAMIMVAIVDLTAWWLPRALERP